MAQTEFDSFLQKEVSKVKGLSYPVRAGFFRRAFIRKVACAKLHPNPNDEFCFPEIGPNYEIMSRYMTDYRRLMNNSADMQFMDSSVKEPLEVERIHPDGYMILNGHHRWGAACRVGIARLPVRIVDLTQESDLQEMLAASTSTRRVTLDLDEVVFRPETDPCLEPRLRFPLNRIYRERLRLGIPALFHMLNSNNYDIWIYTSGYYSMDYLRYYLKHYHVHVAGIVTGLGRKAPSGTDMHKALEKLMNAKYKTTIHIDNVAVVRTVSSSMSFDEYPLSGGNENWSLDVMRIFDEMKKDERAETNP